MPPRVVGGAASRNMLRLGENHSRELGPPASGPPAPSPLLGATRENSPPGTSAKQCELTPPGSRS